MLSDAKILQLYKDERFPGSFSGGHYFKQCLKTELNENISLKRIYALLQSQPYVVYQMKQAKRFPRRRYDVKSYLELLQVDLGQMYLKNGFRFFLAIVDVFSNKLWCYPLQSKDTATVKKAFDEFFKTLPVMPSQIASDQGKFKY